MPRLATALEWHGVERAAGPADASSARQGSPLRGSSGSDSLDFKTTGKKQAARRVLLHASADRQQRRHWCNNTEHENTIKWMAVSSIHTACI